MVNRQVIANKRIDVIKDMVIVEQLETSVRYSEDGFNHWLNRVSDITTSGWDTEIFTGKDGDVCKVIQTAMPQKNFVIVSDIEFIEKRK